MSEPEGTTVELSESKSLVEKYLGLDVRVYLTSGTILSGRLEAVKGYEALIKDIHKGKESFINLAHVISISKL